jgi:hypothetical protein
VQPAHVHHLPSPATIGTARGTYTTKSNALGGLIVQSTPFRAAWRLHANGSPRTNKGSSDAARRSRTPRPLEPSWGSSPIHLETAIFEVRTAHEPAGPGAGGLEDRRIIAGWPLRIAPQGLPRIRTCRFPASGSSSHGFAARDMTEWTMRGRGRGNLFSTSTRRSQFMPRLDRRASHLTHARSTARWKAPS